MGFTLNYCVAQALFSCSRIQIYVKTSKLLASCLQFGSCRIRLGSIIVKASLSLLSFGSISSQLNSSKISINSRKFKILHKIFHYGKIVIVRVSYSYFKLKPPSSQLIELKLGIGITQSSRAQGQNYSARLDCSRMYDSLTDTETNVLKHSITIYHI